MHFTNHWLVLTASAILTGVFSLEHQRGSSNHLEDQPHEARTSFIQDHIVAEQSRWQPGNTRMLLKRGLTNGRALKNGQTLSKNALDEHMNSYSRQPDQLWHDRIKQLSLGQAQHKPWNTLSWPSEASYSAGLTSDSLLSQTTSQGATNRADSTDSSLGDLLSASGSFRHEPSQHAAKRQSSELGATSLGSVDSVSTRELYKALDEPPPTNGHAWTFYNPHMITGGSSSSPSISFKSNLDSSSTRHRRMETPGLITTLGKETTSIARPMSDLGSERTGSTALSLHATNSRAAHVRGDISILHTTRQSSSAKPIGEKASDGWHSLRRNSGKVSSSNSQDSPRQDKHSGERGSVASESGSDSSSSTTRSRRQSPVNIIDTSTQTLPESRGLPQRIMSRLRPGGSRGKSSPDSGDSWKIGIQHSPIDEAHEIVMRPHEHAQVAPIPVRSSKFKNLFTTRSKRLKEGRGKPKLLDMSPPQTPATSETIDDKTSTAQPVCMSSAGCGLGWRKFWRKTASPGKGQHPPTREAEKTAEQRT